LRDADNVAGQVAIGTTLLEQGNNFIQERKYEEARAAYMRASEVMKAPDDKVYVASALKGIAKTYQEQGNFAEADKAYERAQVFVFKISHPFAHADLVGILKERILVLEKLGHSGQAAALEKQLNAAIASNSSATN
jgi:tetratricopeptide (TPR) repeat protein